MVKALDTRRRAAVADVEAAAERATTRVTEATGQLLREAHFGLALLWAIVLVTGTGTRLLIHRLVRPRGPAP